MRARFWVAISVLSCSVVGCGDDGTPARVDAGRDAGGDAGGTVTDAGTDGGLPPSDAGVDTGTAPLDAATDGGVAPDASSCVATGDEVCDGTDNDCAGGVDDGLDCQRWAGSGADGDLTLSTTFDIGTDTRPGGTAPLAPSYPITTIDGADVTLGEAPSGIAAGDEVLILNLRGSEDDSGSVGNYETRFVATVAERVVTLRNDVVGTYGVGGNNEDLSGQSVVMIRVPHIADLFVGPFGGLTTAAFDGDVGGVLYLRAESLVTDPGGTIDLSRRGYRGRRYAANGEMGETGESLGGWSTTPSGGPPPANHGGGGGGTSDCDTYTCTTQTIGAGGGGASYGTAGGAGADNGGLHIGGLAGMVYGDASLDDLFLGSGGGGGAGGVSGPGSGMEGGNGGGLLVIHAGWINAVGPILANGQIGSHNDNCGSQGGGGGGAGAGGTIWLTAATMLLGDDNVRAVGGMAQCNGGGVGGDGRVRVDFTTLNSRDHGTAEATAAARAAATPDPGTVGTL